MIELYFLIFRIPKMMSALARERNRSPVAWSLFGIAAWIGAELFVALGVGFTYGMGEVLWGWPEEIPPVLSVITYVAALGAAIGALTLVRRILTSRSRDQSYPLPPPPPPSF